MFYLPIIQEGQVVDALIATIYNNKMHIFDRELFYKRRIYSFFRFANIASDMLIRLLSKDNSGYYPYLTEVNEAYDSLNYVIKNHPLIFEVVKALPFLDVVNPTGWQYTKGDLEIVLDAQGCAVRMKGRALDTSIHIITILLSTTPRFLVNDKQGLLSFKYLQDFVKNPRIQEGIKFVGYRYYSIDARLAL